MSIRMAAAFGAVMLAVAFSAGPALAHDGHDHGAAPPPVSKSIAPRGEAVSDAFELTAIPKDGKITFYLDRFRTNEPIRGATLEVETPDGPKAASQTEDAGYLLPAPWLAKPGSHDLLVTVTAGDVVDVLTVALTIPETKATAASPVPPGETAIGKASAALADLKARLVAKDPVLMLVAAGAFLLGMLITAITRGRRSLPAVAVVAVAVTLALGTAAFAHGDEDHGAPSKDTPVQGSALLDPLQPSADLAQRFAGRLGVRAQADATAAGPAHDHDRSGDVPPDGRVAGPGHPRPERQRRGAVLGGRAPVAAAFRPVSPARDQGEERRRAGDRNPAGPGRRRLGHAPAPGRARPADRRRRASGRALPQARPPRAPSPRPSSTTPNPS